MAGKDNPIAIDYILNHYWKDVEKRDVDKEVRRNKLTVCLKNAVMFMLVKRRA